MELKRGRLIDHVHLRARDLVASKAFYRALFKVLGVTAYETEDHLWADEFWIDAGEQESRVHLAFQAPDEDTVRRFYAAALAAGGRDHGSTSERPEYHPGFFGAYLLDPDGTNTEAVWHGPASRAADAVTVTVDLSPAMSAQGAPHGDAAR